jgi:hypothetical protein
MVVELVLVAAAAGALAVAGQLVLAVVLGVGALLTSLLNASQDAPGSTDRQIRRLVLYVHPVSLSAVCAAHVGRVVQPVRSCEAEWRQVE